MKITEKKITIKDLARDYADNGEGGVSGFGGNLDIRPAYQREFVYKDDQRNAVIETVQEKLPLNTMYWADIGGQRFEIIDGQQRTISICQYVAGDFSVDGLAFHNLPNDKKQQILNYPLMVYVCTGTDSERLKWFETINIAGAVLTKQELRNAIYHGPWLAHAKQYFSRPRAPAQDIGRRYIRGDLIRQEYLETAIKWKSENNIERYMSQNQHKESAKPLWEYFSSVIDWIETTFPTYRKEMKGIQWGPLYDRFKDKPLDPAALEASVKRLLEDEDVTRKKGVYPYVLTGNERELNIRAFTPAMTREAFERQNGVCAHCDKTFKRQEMQADHIKPWSQGGKTIATNCQMLCAPCNRTKSNI